MAASESAAWAPLPATGRRTLVSRDLSRTFQELRREGKGNLRGGTVAPLLGNGRDIERGGANLPPQWVDFAEDARGELSTLRHLVSDLKKAHKRRQLDVMSTGSPDIAVESVSAEIATCMRKCEKLIHQVASGGGRGGPADLTDAGLRRNMQRSLAAELQKVSKDVRESQQQHLSIIRKREDRNGGSSSRLQAKDDQGYTADQMQELETMEMGAAQRTAEVCQIATSISELNRMFKDLAVLVVDQGTVLDRIDYNMETVLAQSEEAVKQLTKAKKNKDAASSRAFKCFLFWLLADIIMLFIWLAKMKVKYGMGPKEVCMTILAILACCGVTCGICRYKQQQCQARFQEAWAGVPSLKKVFPQCDPQKMMGTFRPQGPVGTAKAAVQVAQLKANYG